MTVYLYYMGLGFRKKCAEYVNSKLLSKSSYLKGQKKVFSSQVLIEMRDICQAKSFNLIMCSLASPHAAIQTRGDPY